MQFTSSTFIAFSLITALLIQATSGKKYQNAILFIANLVFIASYVDSPLQVAPLLAFLIWTYGMVESVRRRPTRTVLTVAVASTIALFIVLKHFSFLGNALVLPFPYLTIGLSYILFRTLQLMIDTGSGELPSRVSPLAFFNYTCNFLSFVSGPIQRYQDFRASYDAPAPPPDPEVVFAAFSRVVTGFFKLAVISATANYLFTNLSDSAAAAKGHAGSAKYMLLFASQTISYTVYLYYNFSGYMDIVIGIGRLLGQSLPENFNQPFLARNFLEFWSRWHMTLSDWFKLYLFNPLLKVLIGRFPSPALAPYLGCGIFFVTFLVMGLWHGTTAVYVVYGLFLGLGASVNKFWQVWLTKRLGKKGYRALSERTLYLYLCRGLTFSYFAIALTCLWTDLPAMVVLGKTLGVRGVIGSFVIVTLVGAIGLFLCDKLLILIRPLLTAGKAATKGTIARNLVLATRIVVIMAIGSFFKKAPEFVYKAF